MGHLNAIVTVAVGDVKLVAVAAEFPAEATEAHVCIRADDVMLVADALPEASARNRFSATVVAMRSAQKKLVGMLPPCYQNLIALRRS